MLVETNGGYDEGYLAVSGFWGTTPGSLVADYLRAQSPLNFRVLDVGAGEGKNAVAFARAGAEVDAVECSEAAIRNGKHLFPSDGINWIHSDVLERKFLPTTYDVIVSYGLSHCLPSETDVRLLIEELQASLKRGGTFILVSFNAGSHDLAEAHPGFHPLLLSHDWYLQRFNGWHFRHASDSLLFETHPHNNIPHHHSMTRISAIKL
ncbi:class I SAM-dependent methyltransferase [Rhizobium leguminosarum]|uniref:class I SAM-dependent methyltransferase n=1 Tax=Rhizobium leguminosarum TaxID=384 RepID=UPI002FEFBABD